MGGVINRVMLEYKLLIINFLQASISRFMTPPIGGYGEPINRSRNFRLTNFNYLLMLRKKMIEKHS